MCMIQGYMAKDGSRPNLNDGAKPPHRLSSLIRAMALNAEWPSLEAVILEARAAGLSLPEVHDLVRAMEQDAGRMLTSLRVDGGATANNLLMQIQADLLGADIVRPAQVELTATGAARLAAEGAGLAVDAAVATDSDATIFHPRMPASERDRILSRWREAIAKA